MKLLKKIVPFLLTLAVFSGCFVTASAATTADPVVGVLTIFSAPYSSGSSSSELFDFGHAFLSFKNTYSDPISVGALRVGRGSEITFGTWQKGSHGHNGIWYNLESYCINHKGQLSSRVSLSMNVTKSNVETINSIIEENDKWGYFVNCSTFASKVWNSVSSTKLFASFLINPDTPANLASVIMLHSGYEKKRPVANSSPYGYVEIDGDIKKFISVNAENILVDTATNTVSVIDDGDFVTLDSPFVISGEVCDI